MDDRTCEHCGALFPATAHAIARGKRFCSDLCQRRAHSSRKEISRRVQGPPRPCVECAGQILERPGNHTRRFCSADCKSRHALRVANERAALVARSCRDCGRSFERWWTSTTASSTQRSRCRDCYNAYARARASYPKPKDKKPPSDRKPGDKAYMALRQQVLAEETHCGFCGEFVERDTYPPNHRLAPTVDHIVPLVLGGAPRDRANLRLAHRGCNARGGNQVQRGMAVAYARAALWIAGRMGVAA